MRTIKGISDENRLSIIDEYLNGASKASLARTYKLKNPQIISEWIRIFGIEDSRNPIDPLMRTKPCTESDELKALRNELKQAKLGLYKEKMRADFYEKMVDVAEDMFNISIRKKAGAK